jgi:hypothetical protein
MVECFLVTVYPVGVAGEQMVHQMIAMEAELKTLIQTMNAPRPSDFDRLSEWIEHHPHISKGLAVFFAWILLGDRVIEFAQKVLPAKAD